MYSVFLLSNVKSSFKRKKFLKGFKEIFRDLKCCVERVKKGYCFRDIWNIDSWFLEIIPDMLDELKTSTDSYPARFSSNDRNDDSGAEKWHAILTEMAFLFREANPETCQKKNPYEEEYVAILQKFIERFGFNGKWVKNKDGKRVFIHNLGDIPKYKELDENFHRAEKELCEYRADCQKKAFAMFAEYFDCLWD